MSSESIWKFGLEVTQAVQIISMPKGARILYCGLQDGKICFWAEVVQGAEKEVRKFLVVHAGWELPPDRNYVGTVQAPPFVWHIYEYRRAAPHPPEAPSGGDWDRVHDLAAQAADELMRHDARGLVVMIRDIAAQHLPEPAPADPEAGAPLEGGAA